MFQIRVIPLVLIALTMLAAAPLRALDADALHATWKITKIEVAGEEQDITDEGERCISFLADGTLKTYEDGEPADEGRYEVHGDKLHVFIDGADTPEISAFACDGQTLTITQEIVEGVELVVFLEKTESPE